MKLYYSPGACSLSPHIVANEAGLPLELVKVDLKTHKLDSGEDFFKINPKGYVPALQLDDGSMLTEGPAIVQYLADLKPETGLIPSAGFGRYKVAEWLTFINGEIHKNFGPLFGNASEDVKSDARDKVVKRFNYVNGELSGKQFLTGGTFTVADAYLFVMTTWAHHVKIDLPENLHKFFHAVSQRPAVHKAMAEEGLVKA
ncbi:MAG: glutathione transferase GstA [Proteobacteria bacterium]|nr:glutathione transferase GstA [Pseudomonadota bacterium]